MGVVRAALPEGARVLVEDFDAPLPVKAPAPEVAEPPAATAGR